ncbi:MAG: FecR domain-containing protein [Vicinamibacteria bacterium]|nr:FecR domain-containing protein [Vicinamibacteria bacterium]
MQASFYRPLLGVMMLTGGLAGFGWAEERDLIARFREIEPGVMVQRASEAGAESAEINLPFMPGDRAWTDATGRAELQFADGSLLWLDVGSKLDFVALESDDQAVLRLWSGALMIRVLSPEVAFTVESATASASTRGLTEVRIDILNAETRVTTYAGEVALENGAGQRTLQAGARAHARSNAIDFDVDSFDPYAADVFERWVKRRGGEIRWSDARARGLPEEIAPYADELDAHGTWRHDTDAGDVWCPHVEADWSPYADGRWIWTSYGWTWVPYERWGWAAYHYGRWGFSPSLGWHWIPGRIWGPAWVSWTIGRDYVGWRPLGRYNHSVFISHHRQSRFDRAWRFARRADFGSRGLSRRHHGGDFRPARSRFAAYASSERHPSRDLTRWERPKRRMTSPGRRIERSMARKIDGRRVAGRSTAVGSSRRFPMRSSDAQRSGVDRRVPSSNRGTSTTRRDDSSFSARTSMRTVRERQARTREISPRGSVERQSPQRGDSRSVSRKNRSATSHDPVSRFLRSRSRTTESSRRDGARSERRLRTERSSSSSKGESRRATSSERRRSQDGATSSKRRQSKGDRGRSSRRR